MREVTKVTADNELLSIEAHDKEELFGFEFQTDADDEDTYFSGNIIVDDENPRYVIDYDGCYELPRAIIAELEANGYDCEDVK